MPNDPTRTCRLLCRLEPHFRAKAKAWIGALEAAGIPVVTSSRAKRAGDFAVLIVETLRSPERQAMLWSWGRTAVNPDTGGMDKVTWAWNSRHSLGAAIDIAFIIEGRVGWDASLLDANLYSGGVEGTILKRAWRLKLDNLPNDPLHFQELYADFDACKSRWDKWRAGRGLYLAMKGAENGG